jgi:hypothetical protein
VLQAEDYRYAVVDENDSEKSSQAFFERRRAMHGQVTLPVLQTTHRGGIYRTASIAFHPHVSSPSGFCPAEKRDAEERSGNFLPEVLGAKRDNCS